MSEDKMYTIKLSEDEYENFKISLSLAQELLELIDESTPLPDRRWIELHINDLTNDKKVLKEWIGTLAILKLNVDQQIRPQAGIKDPINRMIEKMKHS